MRPLVPTGVRVLLCVGLSACGSPQDSTTPAWTWTASPARHALVVVLDTTRADKLRSASTPNLDALVASGARVDRAWSAGTWTVPGTFSLFSGALVRSHGFDLATGKMGAYPPLPDRPTLAQVLQQEGFGTFGAYANPYLAENLGWDRGFETWRRSNDRSMPALFARHVSEEWADGRRHFAYLHLIGPHSPLNPSEAARRRHGVPSEHVDEKRGLLIGAAKRDRTGDVRAAYASAYEAVLEDTDLRVGALLNALGEHRKDTLVVVTSDHGELLGEHDRVGHGRHVWEALTWVPLLADHPHLDGEREALPPAANNAMLPDLVTRSLGVEARWEVTVEQPLPLVSQREGRLAVSPDGRTKGLWDPDLATEMLAFDLGADPMETRPLEPADHHPALRAVRAEFESTVTRGPDPTAASVRLDDSAIEELRTLGYLGTDTP